MDNHHEERDKLFDHEFDGIREYDNPLPGWWVWLFILSVLFAGPYVLHWHFGQGKSLDEQLAAEKEAYAMQLLATYGELTGDRETLVSYMSDDIAMTAMGGVFRGKCAQCHVADGSGNVGPNLTDEGWLNVDRITDIPRILREGITNRGMPAWGDQLTETEIVLLSSYVARMRDNPIDGKKLEGDLLPNWTDIAPRNDDTIAEAVE